MPIAFTQTESGSTFTAVGGHDGYSIRVSARGDIQQGDLVVRVLIGKLGPFGEAADSYELAREFRTGSEPQQAFVDGFAIAEGVIAEWKAV